MPVVNNFHIKVCIFTSEVASLQELVAKETFLRKCWTHEARSGDLGSSSKLFFYLDCFLVILDNFKGKSCDFRVKIFWQPMVEIGFDLKFHCNLHVKKLKECRPLALPVSHLRSTMLSPGQRAMQIQWQGFKRYFQSCKHWNGPFNYLNLLLVTPWASHEDWNFSLFKKQAGLMVRRVYEECYSWKGGRRKGLHWF